MSKNTCPTCGQGLSEAHRAKTLKITELGITPDMSELAIDKICSSQSGGDKDE